MERVRKSYVLKTEPKKNTIEQDEKERSKKTQQNKCQNPNFCLLEMSTKTKYLCIRAMDINYW